MSRQLRQRLLILWGCLIIGMTLGELIQVLLPDESPFWLTMAVAFTFALGAAGLLAIAYQRFPHKKSSMKTTDQTENSVRRFQLETELFQLNQELFTRAQEQADELSRLNVELQLQMAASKKAEEAARISEERFRNMADNIQEGLTILENGRLVYVNSRACEIFGDCPEGELYERISAFAAPEEREIIEAQIIAARSEGNLPEILEYWILRVDGERRFIRERYTSSSANGLGRIFILSSDITESKQAYKILENAVNDRTRELSAVLDVSQRIASTLEIEPLLDLILEQIQTVIPYIGVALFSLVEEKFEAVAYLVPGMPAQNHPLFLTFERAEPYWKAVQEKEVLIIDDILGDTPLARAFHDTGISPDSFSFSHARSWIGIPLIVRDDVIGLLSLAHDRPGFYSERHARIAMTIANQVAIAIENARLYEEAQNLAVFQERHRIARELHDSVTQLLYGITLYCTATSRSIQSKNLSSIEKNLIEIKDNALQALQEMRLLILELDPPSLQNSGLVEALRTSLDVIETRTGLETELMAQGINRLPRKVETELYRIALEALNNLVRYARAKKVTVELNKEWNYVYLEIRDNGIGFDLEKALHSGGMGLHNMEQRTRKIGGKFEIHSKPGGGTTIKIIAPLEKLRLPKSLNQITAWREK